MGLYVRYNVNFVNLLLIGLNNPELTTSLDVGQNISSRLRVHYLRSCLAQDVAYYDGAGSGEMTTRITVDQDLIQESISENAALMLTSISTFVVAFVLGMSPCLYR